MDVDECAENKHDCDDKQYTQCKDKDGGYDCVCLPGHPENAEGVCERKSRYILL